MSGNQGDLLGRALRGERASDPADRLDEHRGLHHRQWGSDAPAYADTGLDLDRYATDFDDLTTAMRLVWQQRHAAAYADMCFARAMMGVNSTYSHELVDAQKRQAVAYRMIALLSGM